MGRVIDAVGACRLRPHAEGTHFTYVTRCIVYQQLSGKAASTIFGRFRELFGGGDIDPARLLATTDDQLRGAGLSRGKTVYLRDLARRTLEGRLRLDHLHELGDEEIAEELVQVKGIGVWTAQMVLMLRLGRPDVLPGADLGIRKGVQRAYRLRALPSPARVEKIGAKWAPYRTVASWYLWRLLEVKAPSSTNGA
jgi:3-methyladenine DNA glycosylase/8-oxoguanine DNA glycosylase